jgi:hypothetical protein
VPMLTLNAECFQHNRSRQPSARPHFRLPEELSGHGEG